MLVITGCQRSGTRSCASMFGLSHEAVFNPQMIGTLPHKSPEAQHPSMIPPGESSWLAVPWIAKLLIDGHNVLHVVRHPLSVINSLEGIGFWVPEIRGHDPYRYYIADYLGWSDEFWTSAGHREKSARLWFEWNFNVDCYQRPRFRIEDIALAPRLNHRNRGSVFCWADVPDCDSKRNAMALASAYGYGSKPHEHKNKENGRTEKAGQSAAGV